MDLVSLKSDLEYILIFLYRNLNVLQANINNTRRPGLVDDWEADEWRLVKARLHSLGRDVRELHLLHPRGFFERDPLW